MANPEPSRDDSPAALRPGVSFGDYDIVRCIGIGGMGSVFEAVHRLMNRRIALKVLHTSIPTTAEIDPRARFMREGAMLVRVQHPNVVAVYDAGSIEEQPYIAMELLEGATLDRLVAQQGRLTPKRAVDLVTEAAEGLEAAHAQGIVHRDVKPENLFITRDARGAETVKLVDFGIAKDFRGASSRNTAIGTPAYMSPEQLLGGHPIDGRCDQYALAVVLYEALTGARPYDAPSLVELAIKLERGDAQPPSARGVPISAALDAVVMRALRVEPTARYPSMAAFAAGLRDAMTGVFTIDGETSARATTRSEPPSGFAPTRVFRRSGFPAARSSERPPPATPSESTIVSIRRRPPLRVGLLVLVALTLAIAAWALLADSGDVPAEAAAAPVAAPLAAEAHPPTENPTAPPSPVASPTPTSPEAASTAAPTSSRRPREPRAPSTPASPSAPTPPSGLILER